MATKTKPAHRIKTGNIELAIWANEGKNGGTYYSVSPSRSFKVGDDWQQRASFSVEDLPVLEKMLPMAWAWIHQANQRKATK